MVDNNIPSIYTNLIDKIESKITSNNANEITGEILRQVLLDMVNNSIEIIKIIDNQQIVIIKGEGENSAALEGKDTIIFDGDPIPNHEKYASHAYSNYSIALGQNNISGINNDINTPLHQIDNLYQLDADINNGDFTYLYFRNITSDLFEKIQIESPVYLFSTTVDANICSKLIVVDKSSNGNTNYFIKVNKDIIGTPKILVFLEHNEKSELNQNFGFEYSEGYYNDIIGFASHIEGSYNSHIGINSHIEGFNNISNGNYTHVEGYKNENSGEHNHIEGYINKNEGNYNHIEGCENKNEGNYNHLEGYNNISNVNYAHIEGKSNQVFGEVAHSEGIETIAIGEASHVEGYKTYTEQNYSHAEGQETYTDGVAAHAEGYKTKANGDYSHSEGYNTETLEEASHAEGYATKASGYSSHAEGCETEAQGDNSHTEGYYTTASGYSSHAEGSETIASGSCSHAEGNLSEAQADYSHAGGNASIASTEGSFVHGNSLIVSNNYEVSFGQYNETTEESTLFSIGIGSSDENRKNAFEVRNVNGLSLILVDGDPIETSINIFMPINYTDLLNLLNEGKLRPGQQYRIIDYITTTSQSNTSSLEEQFDIIVTADSETQLSEIARAINHNEDTYFNNQKISSWELKYCIYNDTSRFSWADTENGKGVIYYMKDEYGNEAPYDFKNIKFDDTYFTFSRINDSDNEIVDASLNNEGICKLNRIDTYINSENKQALNNNIFKISVKDCIGNIIEQQCANNEFKNALGIHVNQYCSNILFNSNNEKYILEGLEIDPYIIPNRNININDFYFNKNEIPVLKNNCKVFLENNIPVIGLKDKVIKITYNEINVLINNSELIIGQEYLITDYYVVIPNTNKDIIGLTSNNYFDILTFAVDKKTLSENVKLVKKEDSQSNFNFNHFDAKYCIKNDIEKYDWVDDENSKGVIYYMKDEYGNEAPYDFLNIRLNYQNFENGVYTFTYINEDGILNSHDGIDFIKNNIIKSYIKDGKYSIPFNIIFASTISECNTFGYNSHHNVIFDNSRYNDFGEGCSYNQLGSNCVYNKFEDNCTDIRFIKINETDNPTNHDYNTSDILPEDFEKLINEPPCENCNYNVINAGSKYLRIYIIDNPKIEKIIQNIKIDDNITGNIKDSENIEYRYIQLIDSQNLDIILLDENSIAFINKGERERQIVKLEEEIIKLKEIIESITIEINN